MRLQDGLSGVRLVRPSLEFLPAYKAALERGWSADNVRGSAAAEEELARIAADPAAFVASLEHLEPSGETITLPDGAKAPRLPGYRRWIWDGEFCGSIGFRWQPGTAELPSYVLGHIGYAVVPWKEGRGCAKAALALVLEDARARGLPWVELTTTPDNIPSQRVIEANGGVLVGQFDKSPHYGGGPALRWRVDLT
ncbi:GNAT family N-acetyltransferase [Phenylobacterium soli]|uniref:GNAT family N-acetyltransferase n=1 Tax=Phenylobacterium soli TaxID=2170551 RepID=UPI001D03BE5F|nr:GNAT family N-acetyltransferase [Phenylobacterium soli]